MYTYSESKAPCSTRCAADSTYMAKSPTGLVGTASTHRTRKATAKATTTNDIKGGNLTTENTEDTEAGEERVSGSQPEPLSSPASVSSVFSVVKFPPLMSFVVVALAVALRVLWVLAVPTKPVGDFAMYRSEERRIGKECRS